MNHKTGPSYIIPTTLFFCILIMLAGCETKNKGKSESYIETPSSEVTHRSEYSDSTLSQTSQTSQDTYIPPPRTVFEIEDLVQLNMATFDTNAIIYPSIENLKECKELILDHCGIKSIPKEIGNLTNLTSLILLDNQLTTLPEEITKLKLENLDVSSNDIDVENLSPEVIKWLTKYDPDWQCYQSSVMDYYFNFDDTTFPGLMPVTGSDKFASIIVITRDPLLYVQGSGPPAGQYYALINGDSSSFLNTIQLIEKNDSMLFRCPPKQLARILTANLDSNTLLLVRGIDNLKVGPIKTWYMNKKLRYRLDNSSDFWRQHNQNRTRSVNLEIEGLGKFSLSGGFLPNCDYRTQWRVRFNEETWRNFPTLPHDFDAPLPTAAECLLWIGDIDGDNLPDLILNPSIEDYGGFFVQLFLSSQYTYGKLWKPAAIFYYILPGTSESNGC